MGAWIHSPGKINLGHEKLACNACHEKAEGSYRQQIQANLQYLIGKRKLPTDIGHKKVRSSMCLNCHKNPKDKHPIYRFLEPRFTEARKKIAPQHCQSCHFEHQNIRIPVKVNFCKHCHQKLRIKKDPIDVPHHYLVKLKQWKTCLGCHDFHGNHIMKTNKEIDNRYKNEEIRQYFKGERQIYSDKKQYKAKDNVI